MRTSSQLSPPPAPNLPLADADRSDQHLVDRARTGDASAFEQLYRLAAGRVFALCLRMTGDRDKAAELTHDAFVRAWERLGTFRGDSAFTTWMHRLAANLVLERQRTDDRRVRRVTTEGSDAVVDSAVSTLRDPGLMIDLERAIAKLPPNARHVFVLHDVEGYRHDEIATRMALAPGTVRAHLHRARQLLMKMLAP